MTTVEQVETAAAVRQQDARPHEAAAPDPGGNWWRHIIALIAVLWAIFPIAYVLSAAFNADQTLGGASLIPRDVTLENFRQLLTGTVQSLTEGIRRHEINYLRWYANTMIIAGSDRDPDRHARGARRVRVQPLPLQGPADRAVLAAADPDVPAAAARRRDLPDRPADRRRVRLHRAEHPDGVDPGLPRRRDGGERLADEGLLRHDPGGARRVGARRRRDAGAGLLGRDPPARGARARRRRALLVHRRDQRVRDRERHPAEPGSVHARARAAQLHRPAVLGALGRVRRRRRAGCPPVVLIFLFLQKFIVSGLTGGAVKG